MLKKKKDKKGRIILKKCRYRGVDEKGRYIIECEVSVDDPRIPYKNTKAVMYIGEGLEGKEVKVEIGE